MNMAEEVTDDIQSTNDESNTELDVAAKSSIISLTTAKDAKRSTKKSITIVDAENFNLDSEKSTTSIDKNLDTATAVESLTTEEQISESTKDNKIEQQISESTKDNKTEQQKSSKKSVEEHKLDSKKSKPISKSNDKRGSASSNTSKNEKKETKRSSRKSSASAKSSFAKTVHRKSSKLDTSFSAAIPLLPEHEEVEKERAETEVLIRESRNITEDLSIEDMPVNKEELQLMSYILEHSDSSSIEIVVSEQDVDTLPFTTFLDDFNFPTVQEFEVEVAQEEVAQEEENYSERRKDTDIGHFVDPLSGRHLAVEVEAESEEEIVEEALEEEEESVFELPEIEELPPPKTDQDLGDETFQKIFFAAPLDDEDDGIDSAALAKQREQAVLQEYLIDFLDKLIHHIVVKLEFVGPIEILRTSLDKRKLIKAIIAKVLRLKEEQRKRIIFNRYTITYFRRKKDYRAITEDDPSTLMTELEKYKFSCSTLVELLEKQRIWNAAVVKKRADLMEVEREMSSLLRDNVGKFEELIIKSFTTGKSEKLDKDVRMLLNKMAIDRERLMETRFNYIIHVHSFMELYNKLKQIEMLGDDLSLQVLMSVQTEINAFAKKIEERERELLRTRKKFNEDLHITAHIRELIVMKSKQLKALTVVYEEIMTHKEDVRECIYKLKLEREAMRKEINELIYQHGLLSKPALLYDYDTTGESYNSIAERNTALRKRNNSSKFSLQAMKKRSTRKTVTQIPQN